MTTTTSPGSALARARWARPEHVAKRVRRLANELAALPDTITAEQRQLLIDAIPASTKASAA